MITPVRFGRYLLIGKLATGGMAEIFLAKLLGAEGFEKKLVLKRILPAWSLDPEFVQMMIDEAKINVALNHANIVQVYELTRDEGILGIAMEFVEGMDLRAVLQQVSGKKIPLEVALYVVSELLQGLAYAHDKKDESGRPLGVVHRDISPQNILLSWDGAVKITDFGIAKATSRSQETAVGILKGKFAYMSPEQASQGAVDRRSDLFSTGIILYELATGERLFGKGGDLDTLERVRRAQVAFSPESDRRLPPLLKEVILRALARDPNDRFQDAAAFRGEILRCAKKAKKSLTPEKLSAFLKTVAERDGVAIGRGKETLVVPQQEAITRELPAETRLLPEETGGPRTEVVPSTPLTSKERRSRGTSWRRTFHPRLANLAKRATPTTLVTLAVIAMTAMAVTIFFWPATTVQKEPPRVVVAPEVRSAPAVFEEHPEEFPPVDKKQVLTPAGELRPTPANALPLSSEAASGTVVPKSPAFGYLNVQAIPWGYVSVAGEGPLETPVRRIRLAAGSHRLSVSYEPEGTVVSSYVQIREGREVTCVASFREEKGIRCRD